jgi:hypothetical protein
MSSNGTAMKQLDSKLIVDSFNSVIPDNVFGVSKQKVLEICAIGDSTWRKYHLMLRRTEKLLSTNNKKPLGFTYEQGDQALDRTSLLLIFTLSFLLRFFKNEKIAIKTLYQNWENIKCQVKL